LVISEASTRDVVLHEVTTPLGYKAVLRRNNWQRHLSKHPELNGHLSDFPTLLGSPDFVVQTTDGTHHYFAAGLGSGRLAQCFLYGIVSKYETDDTGFRTVSSAYFTRTVKKGDVIWQRAH
jgi:hypothetical protein